MRSYLMSKIIVAKGLQADVAMRNSNYTCFDKNYNPIWNLTRLEVACLFRKAGIITSLMQFLPYVELGKAEDILILPEGRTDNRSTYGSGYHSSGLVGWIYDRTWFKVSLSGKEFVIVKEEGSPHNSSAFSHNIDEEEDYTKFYIIPVISTQILKRKKLHEMYLQEENEQANEALFMLREEWDKDDFNPYK